jgi:cytochrome c oxidase cbb3-type subunit 3
MPAFQLPDDQIRSIAAFLHAEATGAASVARRLPAEYPLEKLLVGNAARGARYFESHCAGCHKRDGDLAHIGTRYKPFDLQTKIAFPGGAKPQVEVQEPSGKTVSGTQVYADEFYVTLRDPGGWTHTYKRGTAAKITITDPLREHERLLKGYSDQDLHDLFAFLETFK